MLIDVRDILKSSGLSKTVEAEMSASECGLKDSDTECQFDDTVRVIAGLTNIKGMIRVKGVVKTSYGTYCARCLKPVRRSVEKELDEEYVQFGSLGEVSAEDAEVYEYSDKEINIGLAVREALLLELPIRHLCGDGCLSLCPVCGGDLNENACGCVTPNADERFSALKALLPNINIKGGESDDRAEE